MTDEQMAIVQRGNTEELRALVFQQDAQLAEKDKTIEWQRAMMESHLTYIGNGVSYLSHDRMEKQAANRIRGKNSHKKAVLDNAERQRAERDVQTALTRVANDPNVKAGKYGAILAACRRQCDWNDNAGHKHKGKFKPLTTKKTSSGEYAEYAPLTDWQCKPLKPETLARYYRKRHTAKRGKK